MKVVSKHIDFQPFLNVLTYLKHDCYNWYSEPAFDLFDEIQPDLLLLKASQFTHEVSVCLKEYPATMVVVEKDVDSNTNPLLVYDVMFSRRLDNVGNNSGAIFLPRAADPITFLGGSPHEKYICDIGFLGDRSDENEDFVGRLSHVKFSSMSKVFGYGWKGVNYYGPILPREIKHLFMSVRNLLVINQPDYVYNGILCGAAVITNCHTEIDELVHLITKPSDIKPHLRQPDNDVWEKHTYFDRLHTLFELLKLSDECDVIKSEKEVFKQLFHKHSKESHD